MAANRTEDDRLHLDAEGSSLLHAEEGFDPVETSYAGSHLQIDSGSLLSY